MRSILLIYIIVFVFTGVMTAQDTLFTETFKDGQLQNVWFPGFSGSSNNMQVASFPGNPSGDGWVGQLGNDLSGGSVGQSFSGDINWTDFYFEAQVYLRVEAAYYQGIEFRVDSSTSSAYNFVAQFNSSFGPAKLRFRARAGVTPTVIRDWLDAEVPGGIPTSDGWHKMAVSAQGDQFRIFFDDQELPGGPFTDNTFTSGFIAAYIFDVAPPDTEILYIDDILVTGTTTSIGKPSTKIVSGFELEQNYPNPFNPSTTISFYLPNAEFVNMGIFNALGQKIRNLITERFSGGEHTITWDGKDEQGNEAPGGVYFYKMTAGQFQSTKKMVLMR
jgi:hypothetical protein